MFSQKYGNPEKLNLALNFNRDLNLELHMLLRLSKHLIALLDGVPVLLSLI